MAKLFTSSEKQPHTEIIRIQHKDTGYGPYLTDNEEVNRIMEGSNLPSPQQSIGFDDSDIQHLEDPKIPKKFGFLNEEMMNRSISPKQLKALKEHGYEPVKVKAANVWGNNKQIFFSTPEQHAKQDQRLKQKTKYRELSPEEIKAMNEKINKSLAEKFKQKIIALNDLLNLREELMKGMTEQERAQQKKLEEKLKASPSLKQAALKQNQAEAKANTSKKDEKKESKSEPKEEFQKPKSEKELKPSKPNYEGSAHGESHVAEYNNGHRYTGHRYEYEDEEGETKLGRSRVQNKIKVHHKWDHDKKEWIHHKTENANPGLDVEGNPKQGTLKHKAEKQKEKVKPVPKSNTSISEEEKKKYTEAATKASEKQKQTDKQSKLKGRKLASDKKEGVNPSVLRAQKHVDEAKKPKTIRRKSDGTKVESKKEESKSDTKSQLEATRKKLDAIKNSNGKSKAERDSERAESQAKKIQEIRIRQAQARKAKGQSPGKLSKGMNNAGLGGPGSVKLGNVLPSLKAVTSAGKVNTTNSKTPSLGITQPSKKDPMKVAQQTQNKDIKDIKMKEAQQQLAPQVGSQMIKFDSNGQWSLEKGDILKFPEKPKKGDILKFPEKPKKGDILKFPEKPKKVDIKTKEDYDLYSTGSHPDQIGEKPGKQKDPSHDHDDVHKKERCWEGYEPTPGKKAYDKGSCRPVKKKEIEVAPEGSKNRETYKDEFEKKEDKPFHGYNKKKHSKEGGLSESYRKKYNKETGSNLQKPVTSKEADKSEKKANRRKSFCARMSGVKGPTSKDGKLTRKGAALKRWDCNKSAEIEYVESVLEKVRKPLQTNKTSKEKSGTSVFTHTDAPMRTRKFKSGETQHGIHPNLKISNRRVGDKQAKRVEEGRSKVGLRVTSNPKDKRDKRLIEEHKKDIKETVNKLKRQNKIKRAKQGERKAEIRLIKKLEELREQRLNKGAPKLDTQDEFREFPYPKTDAARKKLDAEMKQMYTGIRAQSVKDEKNKKLKLVEKQPVKKLK